MMKMTITTMMLMMMAIAGMRLPALCLLRANRWFMLLCPRLAWPALPRTMQRGKVKVSSWSDHGGSYSFAHDFPRTLLGCQCKMTWGFTNLCLQSSCIISYNTTFEFAPEAFTVHIMASILALGLQKIIFACSSKSTPGPFHS